LTEPKLEPKRVVVSSGSCGEFREEWATVATSWAAGATMRAAETATLAVMAAPWAAGSAT
jgi:hypothetical protein